MASESESEKTFRLLIVAVSIVVVIVAVGLGILTWAAPVAMSTCQDACGRFGIARYTSTECVCKGGDHAVEEP